VIGSAAGVRLVSAREGEGQLGLSVEGCGVLWGAAGAFAGGGLVWCRGGKVRGPGGSPPCPPCLTAWVGAGEAGLNRGSVHGMATGSGANENNDGHNSFIFLKFCPPGVRSNARKNSNFKFLKNSNWSCQGIQQGFQKYFCCAER
jgi:hypothetical protein